MSGFETDHLVTFGVQPTLAGYRPDQTRDLDQRILQTLAGLAGRALRRRDDRSENLADTNHSGNITLAGYTAKENEDMNVESPSVSPGYFSTMGMPLLAGREFTEQDRDGAHKVAVVNESFARHYFGEPQLAIGHYYGKGGGQVPIDTEIVGVVKDAKHTGVRAGDHTHHVHSVSAGDESGRDDVLCTHLAVAGKRGSDHPARDAKVRLQARSGQFPNHAGTGR